MASNPARTVTVAVTAALSICWNAAASDFRMIIHQADASTEKYLGAGLTFARWPDGVVRWHYNPTNALPPFDDIDTALRAIHTAMFQWQGVCGIRFEYAGLTDHAPDDYEDGLNVIGWTEHDQGGYGGGVADAPWQEYLALGYWPMCDGFVAVHPRFCPPEWSAAERLFSFQQIMVHEIGHILGIGHSDDPNSVLHANPYNFLHRVRPDDIAVAQALYGPPAVPAPPQPFQPPAPAPGVSVLDHYFAVGSGWADLTVVSEVTDDTPDELLFVHFTAHDLPVGDRRDYLVDAAGFPHRLMLMDQQWPNVSSGTSLQQTAVIKTLPGTWWYYVVIEGRLALAAAIDIATTVEWNLPPEGELALSNSAGSAPLSVRAVLTASDPEDDPVTATWHVPGHEPWSQPVDLPRTEWFTFSDPGQHQIFVELTDDWQRYPNSGGGYRRLLHATVLVEPPAPKPRHVVRRHR